MNKKERQKVVQKLEALLRKLDRRHKQLRDKICSMLVSLENESLSKK